jgi:aspartate aminotransferase
MVSEKMAALLRGSSAIRAMFEEGARLAAIYGKENVFDFSLGNPNFPPPPEVKQAVYDILENESPSFVHGYMPNCGYEDVRSSVAESLNRRFGTAFKSNNLIMTVGAAGAMNVIFKTLLNPGDEVVAFAPYFLEYGNFVANFDGKIVSVPANTKDFQPDPAALAAKITPRTKAVIINSRTIHGVIYSEKTIMEIAAVLEEKQREFGAPIFIVSDEPYRELCYDGREVPFLTKYYKNTVVGYSWSKSLSLPGERIGYLLIPSELTTLKPS